ALDQAQVTHQRQVLRDVGLACADELAQLTDAPFATSQCAHDEQSLRVAERLTEARVHGVQLIARNALERTDSVASWGLQHGLTGRDMRKSECRDVLIHVYVVALDSSDRPARQGGFSTRRTTRRDSSVPRFDHKLVLLVQGFDFDAAARQCSIE